MIEVLAPQVRVSYLIKKDDDYFRRIKPEVYQWLMEHGIRPGAVKWSMEPLTSLRFRFSDAHRDIAVLFKLTWGGS